MGKDHSSRGWSADNARQITARGWQIGFRGRKVNPMPTYANLAAIL